MSTLFIVVVTISAIVGAAVWVATYSRIASLRSQVDLAVGTVAAQLQQRLDLIPDVLKAAKEAVKAQLHALDQILSVRKNLNAIPQIQGAAFDDMPPELRPLTAAAQNAGRNRPINESNPQVDVKTYEKLQEIMLSTEKDVAGARRFLQAAIADYNTAIRSFPGALVASAHGFPVIPTARITPQLEQKPNYWVEPDAQPLLNANSPHERWKIED
jgi:LemA protein